VVAVRWVDLGKVLGGLPAWNAGSSSTRTNPVEFLDPNSPPPRIRTIPLAAYG